MGYDAPEHPEFEPIVALFYALPYNEHGKQSPSFEGGKVK